MYAVTQEDRFNSFRVERFKPHDELQPLHQVNRCGSKRRCALHEESNESQPFLQVMNVRATGLECRMLKNLLVQRHICLDALYNDLG